MENEPNGPYFLQAIERGGLGIGGPGRDVNEYLGLSTDQAIVRVRHLNEGYKAGVASREGLVEALKRLGYAASGIDADIIDKALAEDEKGGH